MALNREQKRMLTEWMSLIKLDKELAARRFQAQNWLAPRLVQRRVQRLVQQNKLTQARWEAFAAGSEAGWEETLQCLCDQGEVPESTVLADMRRVIRSAEKEIQKEAQRAKRAKEAPPDTAAAMTEARRAAAGRLICHFVKKEGRVFAEDAGIGSSAWSRFSKAHGYSDEGTVDKMTEELSLCETDAAAFRALIYHDACQVLEEQQAWANRLRDKGAFLERLAAQGVLTEDQLRKAAGGDAAAPQQEERLTVDKLLELCDLSRNAWVPFEGKLKEAPTSQHTLLKLLLGLYVEEQDSIRFLQAFHSDFYLTRDLAALLIIRHYPLLPREIWYQVLEHLVWEKGSRTKAGFENLYKEDLPPLKSIPL